MLMGCLPLLMSGCVLLDRIISLSSSGNDFPPENTESGQVPSPLDLQPRSTLTPLPSSTPENSIYQPLLEDKRQTIPEGYFSFQPLKNYDLTIESNLTDLDNYDDGIFIHLEGFSYPLNSNQKLEDLADVIVASYNKSSAGTLWLTGKTYPTRVNNVDGKVFSTGGELDDLGYKGTLFIFPLGNNRYVFGLGMACTEYRKYLWEQKARSDVEALMNSLLFIQEQIPDYES